MDDSQKMVLPKYQQVAVEIAERISDKRYKVGDKVHDGQHWLVILMCHPKQQEKQLMGDKIQKMMQKIG